MTLQTLNWIVLVLSLSTCARLLFYRRAGSNFKRHYSLVAWLLIVATGGFGLMLLTGKLSADNLNPLVLMSLISLFMAVLLCRGNVATLIHVNRWHLWKL